MTFSENPNLIIIIKENIHMKFILKRLIFILLNLFILAAISHAQQK